MGGSVGGGTGGGWSDLMPHKISPDYRQKKRKERSCDHLSCWFKSWYATHVWMFEGKGEKASYKTAYIYPDSCYKDD